LVLPFRRVVELTDRIPARAQPAPDPERLSWAVGAVGRRLVRRNRCLVEAVALASVLRRVGTPATIRFGAMRMDGRFEAHAWVESGGRILIGGEHSPSDYAVFPTFSPTAEPRDPPRPDRPAS
jgi:hypothetical protein